MSTAKKSLEETRYVRRSTSMPDHDVSRIREFRKKPVRSRYVEIVDHDVSSGKISRRNIVGADFGVNRRPGLRLTPTPAHRMRCGGWALPVSAHPTTLRVPGGRTLSVAHGPRPLRSQDGERRPLPTPDRRSGRPNNQTVRRALPARYAARACHRQLQDCDRFHDDVIRQQRDAPPGRGAQTAARRVEQRTAHCPARTAKCQPGAVTPAHDATRSTTQRKRRQERVRRDRRTQTQHEHTGVLPRRAA